MRITKRQLKSLIRSVISESYGKTIDGVELGSAWGDYDVFGRPVSPDQILYSDRSSKIKYMAEKCLKVPFSKVADMCFKILENNESMVKHCVHLRAGCRRRDVEDCRKCLEEICKCSICEKICSEFLL